MTDHDLKAVLASLKTAPAVHNPVADPKVPKPVLDGRMKTHRKYVDARKRERKRPVLISPTRCR
jgi:hypothetical protein